tara:strand:- start:5844 stop:7994 length:2151 start_codon:yes stop_codon:yes gene_type:complete
MEVNGKEPDNKAERILFSYFHELPFEGCSWFNLDIPGTNEIDCLAWIEEFGFYNIEIKGFRIKDFSEIALDQIKYSWSGNQLKYGRKPAPWKQSRNAARIIASYINNVYSKKKTFDPIKYKRRDCAPYIYDLVYFPFISEIDFEKKFPNVSGLLKPFILFNDCHKDKGYLIDKLNKRANYSPGKTISLKPQNTERSKCSNIFNDAEELFKQEKYESAIIKYNEAKGIVNANDDIDKKIIDEKILEAQNKKQEYLKSAASKKFREIIEIFKQKVFYSSPDVAIEEKYDFKLLKLLTNNDLDKEIETIDFNYPTYRYGYAGTGKTIIALKIAQHLALEEKQVLFTCYNKVLATDIRRLNKLSYQEALKYFDFISVNDIHNLIIEYTPFRKLLEKKEIKKFENTDLFDNIVDGVINSGFFAGVFDYIIIDEAQDLKDYGWKFLLYLAKNGENSLIVLDGREQNLYLDKPSMFLIRFEDRLKRIIKEEGLKDNIKQKKRIYRNKTRTFLYAHSFLEHYPEAQQTIDFISKNESKQDLTLEFERSLGNFPYIIKRNKSQIKSSLKRTIEHCIKENAKYSLGVSGILIVVPWAHSNRHTKLSSYRNVAVEVLNELNIDYLDYTDNENRRLDYLINQIRIVSFHSCRGIEANFTIILGFEELWYLSEKANCDYHKLGYIILSRAKYETYIFIDEEKRTKNATKFLEYSDRVYRNIEPDGKFIY